MFLFMQQTCVQSVYPDSMASHASRRCCMPPSGGSTEMPAKTGNSLTTSTAQAHANMGEGETTVHCGGRAPATTQLAL